MTECPTCGETFGRVSQHFRGSPEHRPDLTQEQYEVTIGLLMGDGSLSRDPETARIDVTMTSPKYLEYLDDIFGWLSRGVNLRYTASECASNDRSSGFNPDAKEENYQDKYKWYTSCHPDFDEFRSWYSTDEKVFPNDLDLTPITLKHWYVGDGSLHKSSQFRLSMPNEKGNENKIERLFSKSGLPKPLDWYGSGEKHNSALWTHSDSAELFDYMGDPLPGFEYKWPEEFK